MRRKGCHPSAQKIEDNATLWCYSQASSFQKDNGNSDIDSCPSVGEMVNIQLEKLAILLILTDMQTLNFLKTHW